MSEVQARRTLVKSPPELWAKLSDPESLREHLAEFGEIRITRTEPERTVAWEGEQVRGTVTIEASGWGTQVSLSARIDVPEPPPPPVPPPPDPVEHSVRVVDEEVVRVELTPLPEPEPVPVREPEPAGEPRRQRRPYELRVVHAVVACRVPERPAPPEPPPAQEPAFDPDRAAGVLADVLEHLGAAHHRPFSRS
jgi:hypothetical protein